MLFIYTYILPDGIMGMMIIMSVVKVKSKSKVKSLSHV